MSARIVSFDEASDVNSIGVRVAPIDVGFDLRIQRMPVQLPADATSASYADRGGNRLVVYGTAAEIATALRSAGYLVESE